MTTVWIGNWTSFKIIYTFYSTIDLKHRKRQTNACTHIYFEQYRCEAKYDRGGSPAQTRQTTRATAMPDRPLAHSRVTSYNPDPGQLAPPKCAKWCGGVKPAGIT